MIYDHQKSAKQLIKLELPKYYSVIADEVADVANKEQLSLCSRYVHNEHVKEVFIDFVEVERITGQVLADTVLGSLGSVFSIFVRSVL